MKKENTVYIPVSIAELWDKYSILIIKKINITDINKLKFINKELNCLKPICEKFNIDTNLYNNLLAINSKLWEIENKIREKEKNLQFDEEFISIARSVYKNNDKRAEIKLKINTLYNSSLIEMKHF